MPNNQQQRSQHKLRRLLLLIDCMSQLNEPKSAAELAAEFDADVCTRSIRRDLDLLVSMKLVFVQKIEHRFGANRVCVYSLNRARSQSLARAARELIVRSINA